MMAEVTYATSALSLTLLTQLALNDDMPAARDNWNYKLHYLHVLRLGQHFPSDNSIGFKLQFVAGLYQVI